MIALEILDYFRSEQIAYGCTPFLLEMYNEALAELKAKDEEIKGLGYTTQRDTLATYTTIQKIKNSMTKKLVQSQLCCFGNTKN